MNKKLEDLMEKYNIPDLDYLERCIIAHDKYGELGEQLKYPLDKLLETNEIYVLDMDDKLKKRKIIGLNFKEKLIYFWMDFCPMYLSFNEYKSMYWLKEDRSE